MIRRLALLPLALGLTGSAAIADGVVLTPAQMANFLGQKMLETGSGRSDERTDAQNLNDTRPDRERIVEQSGAKAKHNKEVQDSREKTAARAKLATGIGWGKLGIDIGLKAADFANAYKPLSPDDSAIGNVSPAGMPRVPSSCVAGSGCTGCFEKAYGDLNHLRFAFAKLGAIGKWTENFTKKSIAFGDSVSGIHGVAGIAWQAERSKIEASYRDFGVQYDNKYRELIGDLEGALREIGVCEGKFFNTPDWYDRHGYMYYSFMADRYRR